MGEMLHYWIQEFWLMAPTTTAMLVLWFTMVIAIVMSMSSVPMPLPLKPKYNNHKQCKSK